MNAQLGYAFSKHISARALFNNIFDEIGYNAYRTAYINQTEPRSFAGVVRYRF